MRFLNAETGSTANDRPSASLRCVEFDQRIHRAGTKGSVGACSWTEHCAAPPELSVRVTNVATSRTSWYALCATHHFRVHQYYDVVDEPTAELLHLLEHWADGFATQCRQMPQRNGDEHRRGELAVGSRGIELDEARAFLRSWRRELVTVEDDGAFTAPRARACPPELHLLGRGTDRVVLHTEYLIQIGALAELVDDHGWRMADLALEQGEWDALGFRDGRVVVAVEAKARANRPNADSLESLRESLLARSASTGARMVANHDRKWTALATFAVAGPVDVLLIASGARWWMRAEMIEGQLRVTTPREERA